MKKFIALPLVLLIGACQLFTLVKPEPVVLGAYTVEPNRTWTKFGRHIPAIPNSDLWTIDGAFLQTLTLGKGINDGDRLFDKFVVKKADSAPVFSKDMTLLEVKDFFMDSFKFAGLSNIQESSYSPTTFGGREGFRLEFSYSLEDGLKMRSLLVGAIVDEKLYLIQYTGSDLIYFDAHLKDAEELIRSVKFQSPVS